MTIQSQQCQKSKPSWGRRILFASGTVETNEEATVHIGDSERYRDWESYAKRWAALTRGKRVSNHLSSKTGSHSKEVAVTNQKATPAQAGGDSMPDCCNRSRRVLSKTLLPLGEREATLRGENELEALPLGTRPNEGKPTSKRNVLPHVSTSPKNETCRMTKTPRARCQNRLGMRRYGLAPHQKVCKRSHSGSQGSERGQ